LAASYRHFVTTYPSYIQVPISPGPLQMGAIGCLETSVSNYQSTMRNIPEKREYHLHRGGSLKLRITLN